MRQPIILLLAPMLVIAACGSSDTTDDADVAAITARSDAFTAAEAAQDLAAAMSFWTDDANFSLPSGTHARGKDQIRTLWQGLFENASNIERTIQSIKIVTPGKMAYEYGSYRVMYPREGDDIIELTKYVVTWHKVDGVWLLTSGRTERHKPGTGPL